jgi:hypothetical protein
MLAEFSNPLQPWVSLGARINQSCSSCSNQGHTFKHNQQRKLGGCNALALTLSDQEIESYTIHFTICYTIAAGIEQEQAQIAS